MTRRVRAPGTTPGPQQVLKNMSHRPCPGSCPPSGQVPGPSPACQARARGASAGGRDSTGLQLQRQHLEVGHILDRHVGHRPVERQACLLASVMTGVLGLIAGGWGLLRHQRPQHRLLGESWVRRGERCDGSAACRSLRVTMTPPARHPVRTPQRPNPTLTAPWLVPVTPACLPPALLCSVPWALSDC